MTEQMTLRGTLRGHSGWVTQIATTPMYPDMLLSASRGKLSLIQFSELYNYDVTFYTFKLMHLFCVFALQNMQLVVG